MRERKKMALANYVYLEKIKCDETEDYGNDEIFITARQDNTWANPIHPWGEVVWGIHEMNEDSSKEELPIDKWVKFNTGVTVEVWDSDTEFGVGGELDNHDILGSFRAAASDVDPNRQYQAYMRQDDAKYTVYYRVLQREENF
jgi:hypothetical protein